MRQTLNDPGPRQEECSPGQEGRMNFLERKLLEARTIICSGPVTMEMASEFQAKLLVMEKENPSEPVTVFINSPGGSADSGFAIYDLLRFVETPIRTVVNGICASAAILVFLAADRKQRFSLPHSRFLIHQPSTGGHGSASDLAITAQQILKMRERYNQIVAEATGQKPEKVLADVDRDFWLTASEAVEYGLAGKMAAHRAEIAS